MGKKKDFANVVIGIKAPYMEPEVADMVFSALTEKAFYKFTKHLVSSIPGIDPHDFTFSIDKQRQ